mgnify:CR=1 FL=1
MTLSPVVERVNASLLAGVLSAKWALFGGLVAGVVNTVLWEVLAAGNSGAAVWSTLIGAVAVSVCAALVLSLARAAGTEVRFGRDSLEYDDDTLGAADEPTVVDYADVDRVVRRESAGDARVGAATFELHRSAQSPVELSHVAEPETVERVLRQRVPAEFDAGNDDGDTDGSSVDFTEAMPEASATVEAETDYEAEPADERL